MSARNNAAFRATVAEYVAAHPGCRNRDIRAALDVDTVTLCNALALMLPKGRVVRAGARMHAHYYPTQEQADAALVRIAADLAAAQEERRLRKLKRQAVLRTQIRRGEREPHRPAAWVRDAILQHVQQHQGCTGPQVREGAGLIKGTFDNRLRSMMDAGEIIAVGPAGVRRYFTDTELAALAAQSVQELHAELCNDRARRVAARNDQAAQAAEAREPAQHGAEREARLRRKTARNAARKARRAEKAARKAEHKRLADEQRLAAAAAARELKQAQRLAAAQAARDAAVQAREERLRERLRKPGQAAASVDVAPTREQWLRQQAVVPAHVQVQVCPPTKDRWAVSVEPGCGAISEDWYLRRQGGDVPSRLNGAY